MSHLSILAPPTVDPGVDKVEASVPLEGERPIDLIDETYSWDPQRFAREQVRGLIRRVFLPGWPRPARQVVFSGVDPQTRIGDLCRRVAEELAAESTGKVALVEASRSVRALAESSGGTSSCGIASWKTAGVVPESSRQISRNLWTMAASAFWCAEENTPSAAWLRTRLENLRNEFEYTIIHADAVGESSCTALLGHLADGLVLQVEAHRTRRLAAENIRSRLLAANVRLLGVVLSGRTFPIPERLYRSL